METITTSRALEVIAHNIFEDQSLRILDYINELELRIYQLEQAERRDYLKQKEVFKEFGIGHKTLKLWVKRGLHEIWLDNRVFYHRDDIKHYLNQHKI